MGKCISQRELKELLHYDPKTGIFTSMVQRSVQPAGAIAGTVDDDGYIRISIRGGKYRAHRLAFLYMTGSFPDREVDHRDRVRTNNAWSNLRTATPSQNGANKASSSSAGLKGVQSTKSAFVARIKHNGVRKYLGSFQTAEQAHLAYCRAANDLHGEFARAA
ncbi:HNH endonuclease [Aminobacter niigataensis]|uniref:HNH endonuclease n=1 Tax=Aminobacter niigataensis TaxID=83265 RepID=UPI00298F2206|nr:HNH endonuclease [Aminobacter niigataensis]